MALIIAHIDDCEDDVAVVQHFFKEHTVYVYETFNQYINSHTEHDLIVSDIGMPDYAFNTFKAAVQREGKPFVVYSGSAVNNLNPGNTSHLRKLGVLCFYEKSKDDSKLIKFVNSLNEYEEDYG